MNRTIRTITWLVLPSSLIAYPSSLVRADGGTVRLSEQKGSYRITVFTTPTPLRAGPVDISVLVQEAATGEPASGVQVTIGAKPQGPSAGAAIWVPATREAATNKLYFAATLDLPEPGRYALEVSLVGAQGSEQVGFELEAGEPAPPWLALWPWVGWPVLAIALFGIHQHLVKRRNR
jgi:hypothetical protein